MNAELLVAGLAAHLVQATCVVGTALLVPKLLRVEDPVLKLRGARLALLLVVLLPLLQPLARSSPALSRVPGFTLTVTAGWETQGGAVLSPWSVLLAILAVGVVARLAFLTVGLARLSRMRAAAIELRPLPPSVVRAEERTGVRAPFLSSGAVDGPITFGFRRPAVLVPQRFVELPPGTQEAVACHELVHVRRRDFAAVALEELARSVFWFHPALWVLLDRIALYREQSVDREVVEMTGDRRGYLRALAEEAGRRVAPAGVPAFKRSSHLVQRSALLKKELHMSKTRRFTLTAALAGVVVASGAAAAMVRPGGPGVGASGAGIVRPGGPGDGASGAAGLALPAPGLGDSKAGAAASPAGEPGGDVHKVGKGVSEPKRLTAVNPEYPEGARKERVQGSVVLEVVVSEKGVVSDARALTSPDDRLAAAAVEAVRKWTFQPGILAGKPVKVRMTVTVAFRLS